MSWQDIVFTIGTIIFSISLIPSIKSDSKPHIWTSVLTGSVIAVFAYTYFTLDLFFSTSMAVVNAALWYILAWQKYSIHKTK